MIQSLFFRSLILNSFIFLSVIASHHLSGGGIGELSSILILFLISVLIFWKKRVSLSWCRCSCVQLDAPLFETDIVTVTSPSTLSSNINVWLYLGIELHNLTDEVHFFVFWVGQLPVFQPLYTIIVNYSSHFINKTNWSMEDSTCCRFFVRVQSPSSMSSKFQSLYHSNVIQIIFKTIPFVVFAHTPSVVAVFYSDSLRAAALQYGFCSSTIFADLTSCCTWANSLGWCRATTPRRRYSSSVTALIALRSRFILFRFRR